MSRKSVGFVGSASSVGGEANLDGFSGSGLVDPFDGPLMNLRNRIMRNEYISKVNSARIHLEDEEIKGLATIARGLDEVLGFEEHELSTIARAVTSESRHGWLGILGAASVGIGTILWAIPGINLLWGTAAYAAGSFMIWMDKAEGSSLDMDNAALVRSNIVDNLHMNMGHDKVLNTLESIGEDEDKGKVVVEWMHEKEKELRLSEENLDSVTDPFHGLIFWKNPTVEGFMGVSVGLGHPTACIWLIGINFDSNACALSSASFRQGGHAYISEWMRLTSSRSSYIGPVTIRSFAPTVSVDSLVVERVKNVPYFVKNLEGSYHRKRLAVFCYLLGETVCPYLSALE